jgi:20S proteasome alpha/beta subunit
VSGVRYYNRQGEPIDMTEWTRLFHPLYQQIARTTIGPYTVSTVWLGLDHNWGDGPPLIFETMIFGSSNLDEDCHRWSTEAQALAGHAELVTLVYATLPDEGKEGLKSQPPTRKKDGL